MKCVHEPAASIGRHGGAESGPPLATGRQKLAGSVPPRNLDRTDAGVPARRGTSATQSLATVVARGRRPAGRAHGCP